jgi:hypothetical protein
LNSGIWSPKLALGVQNELCNFAQQQDSIGLSSYEIFSLYFVASILKNGLGVVIITNSNHNATLISLSRMTYARTNHQKHTGHHLRTIKNGCRIA